MFNGDRMRKLAFGLIAIATLFAVWRGLMAFLIPIDEPSKITQSETFYVPDAGYRPGGEQCDPENLQRVTPLGKRQEKSAQCAEKADEYHRNQSDLVQQYRSAKAAAQTAVYAEAGVRAAIIEVTVVVLALLAAVWAARETREANRIQRKHFAEQNRAWLDVSVTTVEHTLHTELFWFTAQVTARNVGNSPATNVYFYIPDFGLNVFTDRELAAFKEEIAAHKLEAYEAGESIFQGGSRPQTGVVHFNVPRGQLGGRSYIVPLYVSYGIESDAKRHVTPVVARVTITRDDFMKIEAVTDHNPLGLPPD